ncbi:MAG: type I methionyl aminopeptidase [Spirochaetes bacterium]|nr:type I methionyl aminopeptidase [Spirochaetota bacterium]
MGLNMAMIKTAEEIKNIRAAAKIVSEILSYGISILEPGITTAELDSQIENEIKRRGVTGPCKGYNGFPCVSCLSVNDQVTHGIPDGSILKNGDIIDIDLVINMDGYYGDTSKTVGIGDISLEAKKLIKITEDCLTRGINEVKPGNTLGDIGCAIQTHAERNGYSVVRDYSGHFIGLSMHENPMVLNYGKKKKGVELEPGMVFCIEPMINIGRKEVLTKGWDARTIDGELSSRCEHMVLVTNKGHEVLTYHK